MSELIDRALNAVDERYAAIRVRPCSKVIRFFLQCRKVVFEFKILHMARLQIVAGQELVPVQQPNWWVIEKAYPAPTATGSLLHSMHL